MPQEINRTGVRRELQLGQKLTNSVGVGVRRVRDAVQQPLAGHFERSGRAWSTFLGSSAEAATHATTSVPVSVTPAGVPLEATVVNGALRLQTRGDPSEPIATDLRPAISVGGKRHIFELDAAAETERGLDSRGPFELSSYRLMPQDKGTAPAIEAALNVRRYEGSGALTVGLEYDGPAPDATDGFVVPMNLPELSRGRQWNQYKFHWLSSGMVHDEKSIAAETTSMLWQRMKDDQFYMLVPLSGEGMSGKLTAEANFGQPGFRLSSGSHAPDFVPGAEVPLFSIGGNSEPQALADDVLGAALSATGGKPPSEKPRSDIWSDFTLCTWEWLHADDCTHENIVQGVKYWAEQGLTPKTVIVDDGWQQTDANRRLTGFDADPVKFPDGLGGFVKQLKALGVENVVVWMAKDGYWKGVSPELAAQQGFPLLEGNQGTLIPDPRDGANEAFYRGYFDHLAQAGVAGVKMDNQSMTRMALDERYPVFEAGRSAQAAIRSALEGTGLDKLDCMAHRPFNYFASDANIVRVSEDYPPGREREEKEQVYDVFYNAFVLSRFYGELCADMIQTHAPNPLYHRAAVAMQSTLIVSDNLRDADPELIRPLLSANGERYRLDSPAQVTRECLMRDPALEPIPLKAFGTAGPRAGVLSAFNVNKAEPTVHGALSLADVEPILRGSDASAVAVYRPDSKDAVRVTADQPMQLELDEFGAQLFPVARIENGYAVFGLLDKVLSPATVKYQQYDAGKLTVMLNEPGTFAMWAERRPKSVLVDGKPTKFEFKNNLLTVEARNPAANGSGPVQVQMQL